MPGGSGYALPPGATTVALASVLQRAESVCHPASAAAARACRRASTALVSQILASPGRMVVTLEVATPARRSVVVSPVVAVVASALPQPGAVAAVAPVSTS